MVIIEFHHETWTNTIVERNAFSKKNAYLEELSFHILKLKVFSLTNIITLTFSEIVNVLSIKNQITETCRK